MRAKKRLQLFDEEQHWFQTCARYEDPDAVLDLGNWELDKLLKCGRGKPGMAGLQRPWIGRKPRKAVARQLLPPVPPSIVHRQKGPPGPPGPPQFSWWWRRVRKNYLLYTTPHTSSVVLV